MAAPSSISSPGLQEATKNSTTVWQQDLEALFHHAKDRFPDVVWELGGAEDDDSNRKDVEEVWGHKAIVYARAPPSFQTRYFSFRPNVTTPYSSSPLGTLPTTSALSLEMAPSLSRTPSPSPFRSSSPSPSNAVAMSGTLLRLSTSISPALFSNELEYLYTGQGFGEAFEFLFDSLESTDNEAEAAELRIDKLRKDLVFMWRSRLYSDVRISLTGNFSSSNHENTTAIFSSHRFILVSRSPYFHSALVAWPSSTTKNHTQNSNNEPLTLTLPSPPFTPASLHFTLGFIYTGTLIFSHRSYDLTTAFHIMRAATYLSLPTLYEEIQARIVQEMLHGLFHAFLEFPEYERLTAGSWGTGGCRCRQCARRVPRVLEFTLEDDVKNSLLERGARRALVGMFGEGWCTSEFAGLPAKARESLLKGVGKRTTPANAFALLFAAEHALSKLASVIDAWSAEVREMILSERKGVDDIICSKSEACFTSREWNEIMERDGVAFDDADRVEWIMAAVSRGINERNAALVYQTLVSSILLRPHPTETSAPMLSSTSHIRVQVEQARMDILRWIGKRWVGVRQEGGFDELEGWAIKEISDNIEVSLEDLLTPAPPSYSKSHHRPSTLLRPGRDVDSNNDSISMHSSMRVSVLSRNLPPASNTVTPGPKRAGNSPASSMAPLSSTASFKSLSRSNGMRNSSPVSPRQKVEDWDARLEKDEDDNADVHSLRRDSKLTPALSSIRLPGQSAPQPSIVEPEDDDDQVMVGGDDDETMQESGDEKGETPPGSPLSTAGPLPVDKTSPPLKKTLVRKIIPVAPSSTASLRSTNTRNHGSGTGTPPYLRPTSSASSIRSSTSTRSHTSTIRKSTATSPSTRGVTPRTSTVSSLASSRPISNISISTGGDTFRTANSSVGAGAGPRSRTTSSNSTVSNVSSARASLGGSSGRVTPTRPGAVGGAGLGARARKGSTGSTKSSIVAGGPTPTKRPPVPVLDPKKLSPGLTKKPASTTPSVKSIVSTVKRKVPAVAGAAGGRSTVTRSDSDPVAARNRERRQQQEPGVRVSSIESEDQTVSESMVTVEEDLASGGVKTKEKGRATEIAGDHKKTSSTASTASNATLKRKGSSDTITTNITGELGGPSNLANKTPTKKPTPSTQRAINEDHPISSLSFAPRGATLEIGIPCIISSKRKRFKAYARYIGEVEGELGPWVGVEVPVGESWGGDRDMDADRQWHDGTWGGIRYFEIGSTAESEWEYSAGDERASRRRRLDLSSGSGTASGGKGFLKREGDQLSVGRVKRFRSISPAVSDASGSESRGLFVRPQQVLYVVDAVGSDL